MEQASTVPVTILIQSSRAEATPETIAVTILPGQTSAAFVIYTNSVTGTVAPTITVSANGTQKSKKLTINP